MKGQLPEGAKKILEKQQYRMVGGHSAVKTCGWTKNMIRGKGGCYKLRFYGIMSNQCMQMTTSISCANRCKFCWRGYKAPVSKDWKWGVDDPNFIFDNSVKAHHKLLEGFNKSPKASQVSYEKSKDIKHVALSLTGEPIMYPRLNELLNRFNGEGVSTFLVTNAQYPDQIRDLAPITQLYVSMDAPNKELMREIDVPLFDDFWERFIASIDHLAAKKQRTCIRLTMIKGLNMVDPSEYASLIRRSDSDFIEVKAYMHVGASQQRLSRSNMPHYPEVLFFAKEVAKYLPDYELVSEHIPSQVVMLAKKKFNRDGEWWTWIDFPKFSELALAGSEFGTEDYLAKTPKALLGIKTDTSGITLESLKVAEGTHELSEEMQIEADELAERAGTVNESKSESKSNESKSNESDGAEDEELIQIQI